MSHLTEWQACQGDREKRGEMIQAISRIAKIHPKSVHRSFKRVQKTQRITGNKYGRRIYYGKDVDAALYDVWDAANQPCGELLCPMMPEYIACMKKINRWKHSEEATLKLLEMSEGTVKLKTTRYRVKYSIAKGRSTTKPSSLKSIIPIFKGPWGNLAPGNGQIDTVAHCGSSVFGDFAYTVSFIDTPTYWGGAQGPVE